ncbi:hypothetical protein Tco_0275535 [Tanacetum coccineum]
MYHHYYYHYLGVQPKYKTLRIASTQALVDAVTAALPSPPLPPSLSITARGVNTRVTELAELYEHDTQDLYALLEDARDSRTRISQRVTMDSQRVDLLRGGGLCFPRGLGSFGRIESGSSL